METFDFASLPIVDKVNGTMEDMCDFQKLLAKYTAAGYFDFEKPGLLLHTPDDYQPTTKNMEQINSMSLGVPKEIFAGTIIPGFLQLHYQDKVSCAGDKRGYREENDFMTIGEFRELYEGSERYDDMSITEIQHKYWSIVREIGQATDFMKGGLAKGRKSKRKPKCIRLCVYGTDVQGTLFPIFSDQVSLHDLPSILTGITRVYHTSAEGIDSPMLYIAVFRSTFPYHTEDIDLWAINYHHYGSSKIWYVVPPAYARQLEDLVNRELEFYRRSVMHDCIALLRHKNILLDVSLLKKNNIPVHVMVQGPGDMVILPPRAYHSGFNVGFGIAESVNFAPKTWIPFGMASLDCYQLKKRITIEHFIYTHHFDKYQEYIDGLLQIVDPITNELVRVAPPQLYLVDIESIYTTVHHGVTSILLPKIQNGTLCALVEIAGERLWLTKVDAEKLKWRSTHVPVTIPDQLFNTNRTERPPVWTYELATEFALQHDGSDSSNSEPNAKAGDHDAIDLPTDWKANMEALIQDQGQQIQQLRQLVLKLVPSSQTARPSTPTVMSSVTVSTDHESNKVSNQVSNTSDFNDGNDDYTNTVAVEPKAKRANKFLCGRCKKAFTTHLRQQIHVCVTKANNN